MKYLPLFLTPFARLWGAIDRILKRLTNLEKRMSNLETVTSELETDVDTLTAQEKADEQTLTQNAADIAALKTTQADPALIARLEAAHVKFAALVRSTSAPATPAADPSSTPPAVSPDSTATTGV